ncbi:MAG: N-acetylglucosamine-6-phosphate deacetylase [Bacteroidota bacterium]
MNAIIKNGKIIVPDRIIEDHYLIIEEGRIKEISTEFDENKNYDIIDAHQNYVSPGLFDTHIHGAGSGSFETPDKDLFTGLCNFLLENGVTTFLPTILCNEVYIKTLARNINSNPEYKKRIPGIYIEGPFVNPDRKGGINPRYILKPDIEYLKRIIDLSEGLIKMMTIAPELEGIDIIIDYLLDNNIIPSFGHSNTTLNNALSKVSVKNITHLFNAMSGISHKEAGLAALPFINRNIFTEVNGDGIHIDNEIIKMCFDNLNRDKLIFIADAVISAGLPYKNGFYDTDKEIESSERGVRYTENDVLIGSSFLIPDVLRNVAKITNADMSELIKTVTLNPAKLLSVDNEYGSIEIGKRADIVIFDDDFKIQKVLLS